MARNNPRSEMAQAQDLLLVLTDAKGVITYASSSFCHLAGYSEAQLLGQPIARLRHAEMPGGPFKDLWETLGRGQSWMGMLKNRRADGEAFWVDAYISPILDNGQVLEYQAIYRRPTADVIARASEVYRVRAQGKQPAALRKPNPALAERLSLSACLAFLPLITLALAQAPLIGGLTLLLSGALCWALLRWQSRAFRELVDSSQRLVQHPIKQLIYTGRVDEVGQLQLAMRLLEVKLSAMVARIHDSSSQVAEHASQATSLIGTSNDASQEQQHALAGISAAVEEVTATIQEVASNTLNAAELAQQAQQLADAGRLRVGLAHHSIGLLAETLNSSARAVATLTQQSQAIGRILDVIRGIAEQTNLLALNAAIEAARAGETGRGFAVVADEVRSLAQRTQSSTDEIQAMIEALREGTSEVVRAMEQGQSQSQSSVTEVDAAAAALVSILDTIGAITQLSAQIASASDQQSLAAEEINHKLHAIHELALQSSDQLRDTLRFAAQVTAQAQRQQSLVGHLLTA